MLRESRPTAARKSTADRFTGLVNEAPFWLTSVLVSKIWSSCGYLSVSTQKLFGGALAAQALAKQAIDGGLDVALADGLAIERARFVDAFRTEDSRIGVQSFLEQGPGKAEFTGR